MQCDICRRPPSTRLPFNCTNCARGALYDPRIQHAQALLEAESVGREVERNIGDSQPFTDISYKQVGSPDSHPTFAIERTTAKRVVLAEQTEKIIAQAQILRHQIDDMQVFLAKQREEHVNRRSNLEAAKRRLYQRQSSDFEPLQKNIKRGHNHWDVLHAKTAESRTFLCKEAAFLYGLQQHKRKKGLLGRDSYYIGGLPIPNLRDLNNASPTQISASTTNLAHLVHLASHYLSLRLPAEITLPHRDYPLPTISSPGSSYNAREAPYPGFTPTHSLNNSPSASRMADTASFPRPRPLHIEKKLAVLAKEEPIVYASFVEGITLLAWDVAWMCKSQGLDIGRSSWEDVCAMGRNLWQLLLGPPPDARKQLISKNKFDVHALAEIKDETQKAPSMLGHFSHGTAHSFLYAAKGLEYMSGWRLNSPLKVIERVKAMLQNERDGAEWQLLEENEWEDAEAQNDVTDVVDEEPKEAGGLGSMSQGTDTAGDQGGKISQGDEESEGRIKGTSGWTKLKSRGP